MTRLAATGLGELGASWDELLASAPGYGLLQLGYFSDPARVVRDSLVIHRDGQALFLLPLERTGGGLVSHPETFACGFLPLDDASPEDVWPAVQAVSGAFPGEQLTVRLKPGVVSPALADHESGAWRLLRSSVVRSDAVMVVDLRSDVSLSSRRRRGLAKAEKNGLSVRRVTDDEEVRSAWDCIEDVHERRGLPGPLPLDRVRALVALPGEVASVFAVEVEGQIIGAALAYRMGQAYRLPTYGMLAVPEAVGGTEAVIQVAADVGRAAGCDFLDLGTSTDPTTGETVPGIAAFKAEMGARPRPVEHLALDLPPGPPA